MARNLLGGCASHQLRLEQQSMTRSTILIVARERSVREGFAAALVARGWLDVETCATAAEAVGMLVRGAFGVVVVHAEVGDMSGIQAVPVLRAADRNVKIVFATPESTAELEARVRDADVFYYYLYGEGELDELAAVVEEGVGPPRLVAAGTVTVLVVDDDPDFRESMRLLLSSHGFRVACSATAGEGLDTARTLRPDVVLLDIMMETATDGCLFSRQLRQDPHLKHTPILAVSGVQREDVAAFSPRAVEELLPVDGFVRKPVQPEVLLRRIEQLSRGDRQP